MPRKNKKGKKQSKLSKVLSVDKRKYDLVPYLLKKMSPKEIEGAIKNLSKRREFSKQINLSADKKFCDFYNINLPYLDLDKNLSWCLGVLDYHSDLLNTFRILEQKLQESLLNEDFNSSLEIIDEIDEKCGVSVFTISIKASIYKILKRDDLHSILLSSIQKNEKYSNFFKTICKYNMDRYDESFLNISSSDSLRKQIVRTMDKDISSFLIYKVTPKDYLSSIKIDYNVVIEHEKRCSIIDLYKSVIELIENDFVLCSELSDQFKYLVRKVNKITKHPITRNIVKYNEIDKIEESCIFNPEIIDLYTRGNYSELISAIDSEKYYCFSTFELIAKSVARCGKNPFKGVKGKIIDNICSIILKKDNYYSSYHSILNICNAYSTIPWFKELQLFISKESRFIDETLNNYLAEIVSINAEEDTPRKLNNFDSFHKKIYLEYVDKKYPRSITVDLFKSLSNIDINNNFIELVPNKIDTIRYKKYQAISLFKKGDFSKSIEILEHVIKNGSQIDSYDGLNIVVNAYIYNNKPEKAIEIFVDSVLSNRNNILIFDIKNIANSAKKLIAFSKHIEISIALDLYTRYVDDNYQSALRVSLDNFITNNKLNKPLDLTLDNTNISENKINYFLEYVCSINNMKLSMLFSSKKEIDNYRIKICNYLIDKGISRDKLIEEVKLITKDHVFKKAIEQVDNSRIYIDEAAFKFNLPDSFNSIFSRYLEFNSQEFSDQADETSLNQLYDALIKERKINFFEAAKMIHIQDLTYNEKNRTFHKLMSMFRDEFTFGEKGLNSYLSTRIRHGVLPTELRKPPQKEKIWMFAGGTDVSKVEMYWESLLPSLKKIGTQNITQSLKKFTLKYEKLIDEINDNWLQIVSLDQDISNMKSGGTKNKALFDFSISMIETFAIQKLANRKNYDELIDIVLEWLWNRTDTNLNNIRQNLNSKAIDMFKIIYDSLEEDILSSRLSSDDKQSFLSIARRSNENLRNTLNTVSAWFNRSKINHIEFFDIQTAIDIASRSINVKVQSENNLPLKIKGRYLSSFVDILYILFENSLSKCELPSDELLIDVMISNNTDKFVIKVGNNCKKIDSSKKNKKLLYYKNSYGNTNLMNSASQNEGGTGLFKIFNIIKKDFDVDHNNNFSYVSDCRFEIEIIFSNLIEVVSHEDSNC